MKYLERVKFLDAMRELRKNHRVILITGFSGSGKSSLLAAVAREIRNEKPPVRIVQTGSGGAPLTGEQLQSDARALGAGVSALFVDNAETVEELGALLLEIILKYQTTVFVTGKNTVPLEAKLGSAPRLEMAILRVGPFSYGEFLAFHGLPDSRKSFELYARTGGLPETGITTPESTEMASFLEYRANSFLLVGIIERRQVRNPGHLRKLLELVALSTGEALPARTVCEAFAADRMTISPQAVLDYFGFCRESGILVPVPVYDINRKKALDTGNVWYFADNGLRSAFLGNQEYSGRQGSAEMDRAVENLVFLHLSEAGWNIAQGRVECGRQTREKISFVCEKDGKKLYVQTSGNSATAGDRLRKRLALLAVRDAWPKYIIDADSEGLTEEGIRQVYVREFLLAGLPA